MPHQKPNRRRASDADSILANLTAEESQTVLGHLVEKHPELRIEAEPFAATLVSSGHALEELLSACNSSVKSATGDHLLATLTSRTPEWAGEGTETMNAMSCVLGERGPLACCVRRPAEHAKRRNEAPAHSVRRDADRCSRDGRAPRTEHDVHGKRPVAAKRSFEMPSNEGVISPRLSENRKPRGLAIQLVAPLNIIALFTRPLLALFANTVAMTAPGELFIRADTSADSTVMAHVNLFSACSGTRIAKDR